jgi:LmbE family N-acetylglucosaminyl deacetylase
MQAQPRLQVVVAHPDDETFGCGSLLLHAAAAGALTAVTCATRGEAGGTDPELGQVRERELRRAAEMLGVARVGLLGFADSGMSGRAGPDTVAGAAFDRVLGAVRESMRAFDPDVVVTLDAADGHRDHVRIRDATLEAARQLGVARAYLLCLPRSLVRRWIAHMRAHRPDIEHLAGDTAAMGTPDEDITTLIDATDHLPRRERAMAVHASQTSPFAGLPEDLRRAFLGTIHARRVLPPWPGGEPETDLFSRAARPAPLTRPTEGTST